MVAFVKNYLKIFDQSIQCQFNILKLLVNCTYWKQITNKGPVKFITIETGKELHKSNNGTSKVKDLIFRSTTAILNFLTIERIFIGLPIFNWINLYSRSEWNEIDNDYDFAAFIFGKTLKKKQVLKFQQLCR